MGRRSGRYEIAIALVLTLAIIAGAVALLVEKPWHREGLEIVLSTPSCYITFCVVGEVQRPGIYGLDGCDLCLEDAVDAAGGYTGNADRNALALAAPLSYGDVIRVPCHGDVPQRVNINNADLWLLQALPGIGSTLAGRIVEYREEKGPFGSVDELMMVNGIGQHVFDGLKDLVTVELD